jgi:ribosomal protein S18 acetylase RimI-like enzyme
MAVIRLATPRDADHLLALQRRLDTQSTFMLLEPEERDSDSAALQNRLASHRGTGSFDLLASVDGFAVGWISVEVMPYRRARKTGYVVLGVDSQAKGRGIGTSLLAAAEEEGSRRGLCRLELTVMSDNLRALHLYLRSGFQIEGLRREALHLGSTPIDEYYMARLLRASEESDWSR